MSETNSSTNQDDSQKSIWVRFLTMLLLAFLFSVAETVLYVVALIGFFYRLFGKAINSNITSVGRSIGLYIQQIAEYLSFNTEELPFPFSNWPTGNEGRADRDESPDNTESSPVSSTNSS